MASDSRGQEVRSVHGNHNHNGSLCVSSLNRCQEIDTALNIFPRLDHGTVAAQEQYSDAGDNLSCCVQCLGCMVLAIAGGVRDEENFSCADSFADGFKVIC